MLEGVTMTKGLLVNELKSMSLSIYLTFRVPNLFSRRKIYYGHCRFFPRFIYKTIRTNILILYILCTTLLRIIGDHEHWRKSKFWNFARQYTHYTKYWQNMLLAILKSESSKIEATWWSWLVSLVWSKDLS